MVSPLHVRVQTSRFPRQSQAHVHKMRVPPTCSQAKAQHIYSRYPVRHINFAKGSLVLDNSISKERKLARNNSPRTRFASRRIEYGADLLSAIPQDFEYVSAYAVCHLKERCLLQPLESGRERLTDVLAIPTERVGVEIWVQFRTRAHQHRQKRRSTCRNASASRLTLLIQFTTSLYRSHKVVRLSSQIQAQ